LNVDVENRLFLLYLKDVLEVKEKLSKLGLSKLAIKAVYIKQNRLLVALLVK
jgi:hypothetical protein